MSFNLYLKEKKVYRDDEEFGKVTNTIINFLEKINAVIIEKSIKDYKSFKISCNIYPNFYRELISNLEEYVSIETVSYGESLVKGNKKDKEESYSYYESLKEKEKDKTKRKPTEEEEMQETFSKMKVSNHMIDRMLNELDEEKGEEAPKKENLNLHKMRWKFLYGTIRS